MARSYPIGYEDAVTEYGFPVSQDSFVSCDFRYVNRTIEMPEGVASATNETFMRTDLQEFTLVQVFNSSAWLPCATVPSLIFDGYALCTGAKINAEAGKLPTLELTLIFAEQSDTPLVLPEGSATIPDVRNRCNAVVYGNAPLGFLSLDKAYSSTWSASSDYQLIHRNGVLNAVLVNSPQQSVQVNLKADYNIVNQVSNGWVISHTRHNANDDYLNTTITATKREEGNMALFTNYLDGKRVLTPSNTTTREETNVISVAPVLGGLVTVTKTTTVTHYEEEYVFLSASAAENCIAEVTDQWTKTWADQILSSTTTMDETGLWDATISVETKQRNECVADISTSIDHSTGAYTVTVSVNWERLSCESNTSTVSGRINAVVGTNVQTT